MPYVRFLCNAQWRGEGYFEHDVVEMDDATAQAYVSSSQAEVVSDEVVAAAQAEADAAQAETDVPDDPGPQPTQSRRRRRQPEPEEPEDELQDQTPQQ